MLLLLLLLMTVQLIEITVHQAGDAGIKLYEHDIQFDKGMPRIKAKVLRYGDGFQLEHSV